MEFKIKKQVEETITLETPAYFSNKYCPFFYRITDKGLLTVSDNIVSITEGDGWEKQIPGVISQDPSTELEFERAYQSAQINISLFKNLPK